MAKSQRGVPIWPDMREAAEAMSLEDAARFLLAIVRYGEGEEVENDGEGSWYPTFLAFKFRIDKSKSISEARSKAGKRGMEKRWTPKDSEGDAQDAQNCASITKKRLLSVC